MHTMFCNFYSTLVKELTGEELKNQELVLPTCIQGRVLPCEKEYAVYNDIQSNASVIGHFKDRLLEVCRQEIFQKSE